MGDDDVLLRFTLIPLPKGAHKEEPGEPREGCETGSEAIGFS